MRHVVVCAVLALVAVVLQVMLVDRLPLPGGSVPDIALLLVVALGLIRGPATGMLTGFLAGLDLDLAPPASHPLGESALILCLIGYGCGRLSIWLDRSVLRVLAAAMIGTSTAEALQAAIGLIVGDPRVTVPAVRHVLPVAVLYDVALCPVVLSLVTLASRWSQVRQPGTHLVRGQAEQRPATALAGRPAARPVAQPRRLPPPSGHLRARALRTSAAAADRNRARARRAPDAVHVFRRRMGTYRQGRHWPSGRSTAQRGSIRHTGGLR